MTEKEIKIQLEYWGDCFKVLTDREREVLLMRCGFTGKAMTLKEIGDKLGISRERVRQIEDRALIGVLRIINYKN